MATKVFNANKHFHLEEVNASEEALKHHKSKGSMRAGLNPDTSYAMVIVGSSADEAKSGEKLLGWNCELVMAAPTDRSGATGEFIVGLSPFAKSGFGSEASREKAKFHNVFIGSFSLDKDGKKVWDMSPAQELPEEFEVALRAKYEAPQMIVDAELV